MTPAAGDARPAIGKQPSAQRKIEFAGAQSPALDQQRLALAQGQRPGKANVGPRQAGQRGIVGPHHPPSELRFEQPWRGMADPEEDFRGCIRRPQIAQGKAAHRDRARQCISACLEIAAQRQPGAKAGDSKCQIIRTEFASLQRQHASTARADQARIDSGVAGQDPADPKVKRQGPARSIKARGAALDQLVELQFTEAEPGGCESMFG